MPPLLQSPLTWLVVVTTALVLFLFVARIRPPENRGIKNLPKNREIGNPINLDREDDLRVKEAIKWDSDKVASETKKYILDTDLEKDDWAQTRIFRALGNKTHPTVLEMLRDPALYSLLIKPTKIGVLPETPFDRACELMGDTPGPEFVEPLLPFLKDPSNEIRKLAAWSIAKTGANSIVPHIRLALADQDQDVRSYALVGLLFAAGKSRLSTETSEALIPDIQALLRAGKNADSACRILFELNRSKARDFFLSKEMLVANSPILHEILKVLGDAKIPVPRDSLKAFIKHLEIPKIKPPQTWSLGETLRLLGHHKNEEDRLLLLDYSKHPEELVAIGASKGMLAFHNLDGFLDRIFEVLPSSGFDALSQPQKLYYAAFVCHNEVNNGGFSQYFMNSSGSHWQDALAGFKAMGFVERSEILNEAVRKFGKESPSTNRQTRIGQLAELTSREENVFYALETRYFDCKETFEVISARYVLKNPEAFGGKK